MATPVSPVGDSQPQPTVFSVLAVHARSASRAHLGAAALLGVLDAAMFSRAYPALWWVSAGFASLAAYGCWGLADRALVTGEHVRWDRAVLRALRGGAVVIGFLSALGVVLGLMGAALGGWKH